jgi:sec-independent protein translocase protein TatA
MPLGIGVPELLILLVVILLVFGPKRLPEMGRSLGKGMREFKDSISGEDRSPPTGEDKSPPAESFELTSTADEIVTPEPSERQKDAVS